MVDEVQQALVRPVEILEDDDERALLREPLEEPPPRREALDAPIPCRSRFGAVGESEQRLELAGDPRCLGGLRDHVLDRRAELGLGSLPGLAFEDAGM